MAGHKTPLPNPASAELDQRIQTLQNMDPFNIYSIHADGTVEPWYEVGGAIVRDLVVHPADLETQVRVVPAQIAQWGRLVAQAQRVVEIEKRRQRQWDARYYLKAIEEATQDGGKKPTEATLDAMRRADPEYEVWRQRVERAAEAAQAAAGILEAFKAKKDALVRFARIQRDGNNNFVV